MPNFPLVLHIVAGSIALVAGAVALYALKGAKLHRKSGMLFVFTMLGMSFTGAVMAALKPEALSVIAGALTFYLVATGLLTLRRVSENRWIDLTAMLMAMAIGITSFHFGNQALHDSTGTKDGFPAPAYFVFAAVALLAALLDARMLLARGVKGPHRLARHLWRMCFAMLIATASFFLGQSQVIPEPMRKLALLVTPVALVLLLMLYWVGRVLVMQKYRHTR